MIARSMDEMSYRRISGCINSCLTRDICRYQKDLCNKNAVIIPLESFQSGTVISTKWQHNIKPYILPPDTDVSEPTDRNIPEVGAQTLLIMRKLTHWPVKGLALQWCVYSMFI